MRSHDLLPPPQHWFYDGEVVCFKDARHVILSIISILVLFVLVILIPALFIFVILANTKKFKVILIIVY